MRALTYVSVVVCDTCKLWPCLSYNRRRDCINLALLRSLYKGGGGATRGTHEENTYFCGY